MDKPVPTLRLRLLFGGEAMLGPGRAELLERIAVSGSIAAAARSMGMSYKRAWSLVESLNEMFDQPLVVSVRGGPGTGGAQLTDRGRSVLAAYRRIEAAAWASAAAEVDLLQSWLRLPQAGD